MTPTLPLAVRRRRALAGPVGAGTGLTLVAALMALTTDPAPEAPPAEHSAVHTAAPPPRRTPPPPPQQAPRPRPSRAPAPPAPQLAAALSGPTLPGFALDLDLSAGAERLVDSTQALVMTEDSVDQPPRPVERPPAEYPPRARTNGITGYVVLNVRVGADGRVEDVQVQDASPAGVFEEVAVSNVRAWRFQPATYAGRPVSVRVTQTLRFELS